MRERAKLIAQLLHDTRRLRDEREKAMQNKQKFSDAISSQSAGYSGGGGGGGGGGGNRYGGYGNYGMR